MLTAIKGTQMNFEPDLIRCILMEVETLPTDKTFGPLPIAGWSLKAISSHVQLLAQANLLKSFDYSSAGTAWCIPLYLTEAGGNFLDAIRSDTVWEMMQQPAEAGETAGDASVRQVFELLRQLAASPEWQAAGAPVE